MPLVATALASGSRHRASQHRLANSIHTGGTIDLTRKTRCALGRPRLETQLDRVVMSGFGTAAGPEAVISNNDDANVNAAKTNVRLLGGELLALWEG